jgi:hypothetical protein
MANVSCMAQGRSAWRSRLLLLVGVSLYALLLAADIAPNPFPGLWDWISQNRPLAPDLAWQERLGARPAAAAPAGDSIAVVAGDRAQIRDRDTGALIAPTGDETWRADWLVVAGSGDDAVVLFGRDGGDGYDVRDPATGGLLFEDDEAVAAWGYQDGWLDLRCDSQRACQLRSYRPGGRDPAWQIDLPGRREGMLGGNPPLAGPRTPEPSRIDAGVTRPEPMPQLLGFPVTRGGDDGVVVVDTENGRVLQELTAGDGERIIVSGDRVIRSTMARHGGVCVSQVTGYDPYIEVAVWGPLPYHLWSSDGVGCEQRVVPLGAGSALTAVGTDGRPVVIDSYDGRTLWTGELDERVEDLSSDRVFVRAADRTTRFAVRLGSDDGRVWERIAHEDAGVVLATCGLVVADRDPNRIYVWDPVTGENRLSISTSARVLACAVDGVLIADGRSIGFAPFDTAPAPATPPPDAPIDAK